MSSDTSQKFHEYIKRFRPLARSDGNSAVAPRVANLVPKVTVGCAQTDASLASAAPVVEARALQEPRRANPLHAPAIPPARCLALRSICKAKLLGLT